MKEISLEESKKIQVEILRHFDSFCRANGIKYSLGDGTLIGAVRHKGYIPWDDDIDVMMLRSEYDRFVSLYKQGGRGRFLLTDEKYGHLHTLQTRMCDTKTVCKLTEYTFKDRAEHGLFIDIIPIDNYPETEEEQKKLLADIRKFGMAAYLKNFSLKNLFTDFSRGSLFIKRIGLIIINLLPTNMFYWRRKAIKAMCRYNNQDTNLLAEMEWWHHQPWVFPKSTFSEYIEIDFEGGGFMAIKDYDTFLKAQYGDYMQLPPEEKRQLHHTFKAYLL